MSDLTMRQLRRLGQDRPRLADPEWAIVDLNLLANAQETVGLLKTMMAQQLGADHPFTSRVARLRRELKAIRADAALVPDDHEVLA